MIITGLVGALVSSSYKWGYFVFACVAFFGVVWNLVAVGRKHARTINPAVLKTYNMCGVLTISLWFIYPIAWGLSEGGNVISSDSEAVFYGILDVLAKPLFGALLIFGHKNIDPAVLGLHIRDYEGPIPHEKIHDGLGSAPAHHGNTDYGVATGVANPSSMPATAV